MKTLTVKGQTWRIKDGKKGLCEAPWVKDKTITIPTTGQTQADLDTILHEILHAACWDLSEYTVGETADALARALWRLGWRKTPAPAHQLADNAK